MAVRSLLVKFIADVRQFVSGTKQATASLTPFQQRMKEIQQLSKSFNLFRGAGALAGVSIASSRLKELSSVLVDLELQFQKGEISGEQYAAKIARMIPIVGNLATAFDNLKYAMDLRLGRVDVSDLMSDEEIKAHAKAMSNAQKGIDKYLSARANAATMIRGLMDELEAIRNPTGVQISQLERLGFKQSEIASVIDLMRKLANERKRLADLDAATEFGRSNMERLLRMGREQRDEKARAELAWGREQFDRLLEMGREQLAERMERQAELMRDVQSPTSDFREISLSRTAIGGLSAQNRQQVMDPQLKETNRLLQLIESRFRTNGATYAP